MRDGVFSDNHACASQEFGYYQIHTSLISRSQVALGHMSCLVEDNGGEQRVTFLYKLAPGPCPKSFGINVARLAQLPDAVSFRARDPVPVVFMLTCDSVCTGYRC